MTNPNTGHFVRKALIEAGEPPPAVVPLAPGIPSHVPVFPMYIGDTVETPSSHQIRKKKQVLLKQQSNQNLVVVVSKSNRHFRQSRVV